MRYSICLSFLILFLNQFLPVYSQNPPLPDIPPLEIPLVLSGNFAELRSGHFHSGIDFKTQGVTGKRVFSIAEGYVSRIKIQTNGYGKSIYINHPDGRTSVYAHLDTYAPEFDKYLKQRQYANQTQEIDLYPAAGELKVQRGQVLGTSGNTGSSAGPHLHFEIRNTASQEPLNALKNGFKIQDNTPPQVRSIFLYHYSSMDSDRMPVARKEYTLEKFSDTLFLKGKAKIETGGIIGIGTEAFDLLDGASNRCGIYSLKLFVAEELRYHFLADRFSFNETKYVNAHTDYSLKITSQRNSHNLFVKPNEKLSMTRFVSENGILHVEPEKEYRVLIEVLDVHGNKSLVSFIIKGTGNPGQMQPVQKNAGIVFHWKKENFYSDYHIRLHLPAGSLYENTMFMYSRKDNLKSIYPFEHHIHTAEVPLHRSADLSIRVDTIPEELLTRAGIYRIDEKGRLQYAGGSISDGFITARISEFGRYVIEADTVPPMIKPLGFSSGANLSGAGQLKFMIEDSLSGISGYKGFIDNEWVLFEYDPKNKLLVYEFDKERVKQGTNHELELYISDRAGNNSVFHTTFTW